jgi:hypothetical protein
MHVSVRVRVSALHGLQECLWGHGGRETACISAAVSVCLWVSVCVSASVCEME